MDKQQQKRLQELAQEVLAGSGKTYEDWLADQHLQLIVEHTGDLTAALKEQRRKI